ncbi:hypothetical protein [Enterococcus sp. AZ196]|uniref:hypothetical protein n=1 Tax=Enterococcus sp. AZ196 TaxID=2774659 RepID=UPI003D272CC9
MFRPEEGAMEIIDPAVKKYEAHFDLTFPLTMYADMTRSEEYDYSVVGAKKLEAFINQCIEKGEPVPVPDDYEDWIY